MALAPEPPPARGLSLRGMCAAIINPRAVPIYGLLIGALIWLCTMLLIAVPEAQDSLSHLYPAMFKDTWTIIGLLAVDLGIIYFLISDKTTYRLLSRRELLGLVVLCLALFAILGTWGLTHLRTELDAKPHTVIAFAFFLLFVPRAISYYQAPREMPQNNSLGSSAESEGRSA